MTATFRAVIFDFDYTLVDASAGIVECVNYALAELGLGAVSAERACRTIGLTLPEMFINMVGTERSWQAQDFARLFVQKADEIMNARTNLFPYVPETVAQLSRCGLKLGIVSTKYRYRIERFMGDQGLLTAFKVILGLEDVPAAKPDPSGLRIALERLEVEPTAALYVGDSLVDAEAAQRAGIPFVAVLSGATKREAFASYPVHAVLENVAGVPGLLHC